MKNLWIALVMAVAAGCGDDITNYLPTLDAVGGGDIQSTSDAEVGVVDDSEVTGAEVGEDAVEAHEDTAVEVSGEDPETSDPEVIEAVEVSESADTAVEPDTNPGEPDVGQPCIPTVPAEQAVACYNNLDDDCDGPMDQNDGDCAPFCDPSLFNACEDGLATTFNWCDASTYTCQSEPMNLPFCTADINCEDGNPCTDDKCLPDGMACTNTFNNALPGCSPPPCVSHYECYYNSGQTTICASGSCMTPGLPTACWFTAANVPDSDCANAYEGDYCIQDAASPTGAYCQECAPFDADANGVDEGCPSEHPFCASDASPAGSGYPFYICK